MRRVGFLFEQVYSFANLFLAARRAMQGSGDTPETRRFFFLLEPNLLQIQRELREGSYQPGAYRYFTIYEPKERVISVAPFRDRVVHHALVNVLEPLFEKLGHPTPKRDLFMLAAQMRPEEIHPEVKEKLDRLAEHLCTKVEHE